MRPLRWTSPAMFGVVLISLALPFASVSCRSGDEEVELVRVRGIHLVTGAGPEVNPPVARATDAEALAEAADIGAQPFAIVAAGSALAGLALGFAPPARARLAAVACAAIGVASIVVASLRLEAQLTAALAGQAVAGQATVVASREVGYWVALVAFALAGMASGIAYAAQRPELARPLGRRA